MGDYYEFSDKLIDFLYMFNVKKQLYAEYNFEMHSTSTLIINIVTDYETDYEYFKNNIENNKMKLLHILNKQIFVPKHINILYNHVFDTDLFQQEHNRDIYINTIVKYYR